MYTNMKKELDPFDFSSKTVVKNAWQLPAWSLNGSELIELLLLSHCAEKHDIVKRDATHTWSHHIGLDLQVM